MILLHCEQCLLQRNCPEYESLHRREATHYFHPNREYVLKEPPVDTEEVFTEASQWLKSDERQWSLADDGQAISSPCKSEFSVFRHCFVICAVVVCILMNLLNCCFPSVHLWLAGSFKSVFVGEVE